MRTLGPLMPLRVDAGIHSDTVASIVSDIAQSIAHTTIYIEQIGERIDEALAATETMEDNLAAEFLRFANGEATGG